MALRGSCSGGCRELDRAASAFTSRRQQHGSIQSRASTSTSRRRQPRQQPCGSTAARGHGRGGRKRNRGTLARGAKCGAQAPRKGSASRPLGVLGSPPLAVCGSGAARLPPLLTATSVTSPGCLGPRPWLFGAARSLGRAPIGLSETSSVR